MNEHYVKALELQQAHSKRHVSISYWCHLSRGQNDSGIVLSPLYG